MMKDSDMPAHIQLDKCLEFLLSPDESEPINVELQKFFRDHHCGCLFDPFVGEPCYSPSCSQVRDLRREMPKKTLMRGLLNWGDADVIHLAGKPSSGKSLTMACRFFNMKWQVYSMRDRKQKSAQPLFIFDEKSLYNSAKVAVLSICYQLYQSLPSFEFILPTIPANRLKKKSLLELLEILIEAPLQNSRGTVHLFLDNLHYLPRTDRQIFLRFFCQIAQRDRFPDVEFYLFTSTRDSYVCKGNDRLRVEEVRNVEVHAPEVRVRTIEFNKTDGLYNALVAEICESKFLEKYDSNGSPLAGLDIPRIAALSEVTEDNPQQSNTGRRSAATMQYSECSLKVEERLDSLSRLCGEGDFNAFIYAIVGLTTTKSNGFLPLGLLMKVYKMDNLFNAKTFLKKNYMVLLDAFDFEKSGNSLSGLRIKPHLVRWFKRREAGNDIKYLNLVKSVLEHMEKDHGKISNTAYANVANLALLSQKINHYIVNAMLSKWVIFSCMYNNSSHQAMSNMLGKHADGELEGSRRGLLIQGFCNVSIDKSADEFFDEIVGSLDRQSRLLFRDLSHSRERLAKNPLESLNVRWSPLSNSRPSMPPASQKRIHFDKINRSDIIHSKFLQLSGGTYVLGTAGLLKFSSPSDAKAPKQTTLSMDERLSLLVKADKSNQFIDVTGEDKYLILLTAMSLIFIDSRTYAVSKVIQHQLKMAASGLVRCLNNNVLVVSSGSSVHFVMMTKSHIVSELSQSLAGNDTILGLRVVGDTVVGATSSGKLIFWTLANGEINAVELNIKDHGAKKFTKAVNVEFWDAETVVFVNSDVAWKVQIQNNGDSLEEVELKCRALHIPAGDEYSGIICSEKAESLPYFYVTTAHTGVSYTLWNLDTQGSSFVFHTESHPLEKLGFIPGSVDNQPLLLSFTPGSDMAWDISVVFKEPIKKLSISESVQSSKISSEKSEDLENDMFFLDDMSQSDSSNSNSNSSASTVNLQQPTSIVTFESSKVSDDYSFKGVVIQACFSANLVIVGSGICEVKAYSLASGALDAVVLDGPTVDGEVLYQVDISKHGSLIGIITSDNCILFKRHPDDGYKLLWKKTHDANPNHISMAFDLEKSVNFLCNDKSIGFVAVEAGVRSANKVGESGRVVALAETSSQKVGIPPGVAAKHVVPYQLASPPVLSFFVENLLVGVVCEKHVVHILQLQGTA